MSKAQEAGMGPPPPAQYPQGPPPAGYAPPPGQQGYPGGPPPGQPYPAAQPYPQAGAPPPGPQAQYQVAGQPQTVIVTQPAIMVAGQSFRESPVVMNCPHCQANISTSTHYAVGGLAWIVCAIICGVGLIFPILWLGCCFIPFCINSMKNVIHECPNCHKEVGRYDRTR